MADSQAKFATYPSLRDRVIVISGGAEGIGACMVETFALQGAQVVLLDIKPATQLENLQGAAHKPVYFTCDLTDVEGGIKPTAAKILEKFSQINGLINNAANDRRQATEEVTVDDWDHSVAVNLRHQFFLTQALLPGLLAAKPSAIINMGSVTWQIPATGLLPYTTSKAATFGLTRTLAHEFGPRGIRVNSIMPGAVATERQKREILTPAYVDWVLSHQPLKFLLEPDDVARLALWLMADDSRGVTNQSFVIDAGWN